MKRVFHLDDVAELIASLQKTGSSIVLTNGCFDVLHIGHLRCLQKSKALGDVLIVGINSDASVKQLKGPSRPINNEDDRAEMLLGLAMVDYVVIFNEPNAVRLLQTIKPAYYTKGGDYNPQELHKWPEYITAKDLGCKIVLVDFVEGRSSTKVIEQIEN